MNYCPNCGSKRDGNFCSKCGFKFQDIVISSSDNQISPSPLNRNQSGNVPEICSSKISNSFFRIDNVNILHYASICELAISIIIIFYTSYYLLSQQFEVSSSDLIYINKSSFRIFLYFSMFFFIYFLIFSSFAFLYTVYVKELKSIKNISAIGSILSILIFLFYLALQNHNNNNKPFEGSIFVLDSITQFATFGFKLVFISLIVFLSYSTFCSIFVYNKTKNAIKLEKLVVLSLVGIICCTLIFLLWFVFVNVPPTS